MKSYIYIFFLMVSTFVNAQTKESDYFRFYKDGEKYLKLVKYVYFDSTASHNQKIHTEQKIYFYIDGERFSHKKNHKIDTCSIAFLQKIKLDNPADFKENEYNYYRKKKEEIERKKKIKLPNSLPIYNIHPSLKVYIIEKIKNDKLLKYEVDWEYSMF